MNASESLTIGGSGNYGFTHSFLQTDTIGRGTGGDIRIYAPRVLLQEGGRILSQTSGDKGIGGNIAVIATDLVQFRGASWIDPSINSAIRGSNVAGPGGNVQVTSARMSFQNGATLSTVVAGDGTGGDIILNASDRIDVIGDNPLRSSVLVTTTTNGGNAGQLTINTPILNLQNGGSVLTTALGSGNAGVLSINASNITVSGKGPSSGYLSRIGARAELLNPATRKILGAPDKPTGNSGNLVINTAQLNVTDGAIVGVDNQGDGQAGDFRLNTNTLFLDRGGRITAETVTAGSNLVCVIQTDLFPAR